MLNYVDVSHARTQVSDLEGRSRAYSELLAPVLGPFPAALAGEA